MKKFASLNAVILAVFVFASQPDRQATASSNNSGYNQLDYYDCESRTELIEQKLSEFPHQNLWMLNRKRNVCEKLDFSIDDLFSTSDCTIVRGKESMTCFAIYVTECKDRNIRESGFYNVLTPIKVICQGWLD